MEPESLHHAEPDRTLLKAIDGGAFKGEPWFKDRWLIAALAIICGAGFMYAARQPEIDYQRRIAQVAGAKALAVAPVSEKTPPSADSKPSPAGPPPTENPAAPSNSAERANGVEDPQKVGHQQSHRENPSSSTTPVVPDLSTLAGNIPPLPAVSAPPATPSALPETPASDPMSGLYVTGSFPESAEGTIANIAHKLGGGIRPFQEYLARGKTVDGYLVWVPDRNAKTFLEALQNASGIDVTDQMQASPGQINRQVSEASRNELERLQTQRAELTARYFDDAPAVKDLDDQIEKVNKSIASMKTPGRGFAVAKFEVE
jgi:hypothetical protein